MAKSETLFNTKGLCDEFNINEDAPIDCDIKPTDKTPEECMRENITRSNKILDLILLNMNQGNINARMIEVAGQIINNVTNASKEIMSNSNQSKYIKIKEELKKLKEREVLIKEKRLTRIGNPQLPDGKVVNQNIIVSSREDILKLMNNIEKKE